MKSWSCIRDGICCGSESLVRERCGDLFWYGANREDLGAIDIYDETIVRHGVEGTLFLVLGCFCCLAILQ